ncbi:MAG: hypothetical protein OXQ28_08260 [Acidobacteriota bacterium]|nr:hypothetical protein [Acidobacteriota bacterium]
MKQSVEKRLQRAGYTLIPLPDDGSDEIGGLYADGVLHFQCVERTDGKRFWLARWPKGKGPLPEHANDYWVAFTDEIPTETDGPEYTWEFIPPHGPIIASIRRDPVGRDEQSRRYENPFATENDEDLIVWFNTIIAAGIARAAQRQRNR